MTRILMYCTRFCGYCTRAERLLLNKGMQIDKIMVDEAPERYREMTEATGRQTVPQIFIGDLHVGGYDELVELERQGALDALLHDG